MDEAERRRGLVEEGPFAVGDGRFLEVDSDEAKKVNLKDKRTYH